MDIQDYFTLEVLFATLAFILGLVVAKTGIEIISDIKDIFKTLSESLSPDSPGGRDITPKELDALKEKVFNAAYKVWQKYRKGLISKAADLISKLKFW